MTTNILGPGHYINTGETPTRPTPIATAKDFLAWFAQCNPDGSGGTNIDDQWLNLILATLRQIIITGGAQQGELSDNMISEAMARYASGGIHGVDSGTANVYVLSSPLTFIMPKTHFSGMRITWVPANSNSGASTVNPFAISVKALLKPDGTALDGDEVVAGQRTEAWYDPSAASGSGGYRLQPWAAPSASGGAVPSTSPANWDVIIEEQYSPGAIGPSSVTSWATVPLNTFVQNALAITAPSNILTGLPAGDYIAEWLVCGYNCQQYASRLRNHTDSTTIQVSMPGFAANDFGESVLHVHGEAKFTLASGKTLKLERIADYATAEGFGGGNISGGVLITSQIKLKKVA